MGSLRARVIPRSVRAATRPEPSGWRKGSQITIIVPRWSSVLIDGGIRRMFGRKRRRRERLRARAFPAEWLDTVEHNIPYYGLLPPDDQAELRGHMQVFLAEKNFEGCDGLEMTDEVRVTVAAHACALLLHRDADYYPRLDTILVYPSTFVSETTINRLGPVVIRGEEARVGEAWQRGVVILTWDGILRSIRKTEPGFNVAFHEFAHQLDMENGAPDGLPVIADPDLRAQWPEVFQREYDQLRYDIEHGRPRLINDYGAHSPSEFFAVLTEYFFEVPRPLRRRHPELYDCLQRFYQQDPAALVANLPEM